MSSQGRERLATAYIPQLDALIIAATGQHLAIGPKSHRAHQVGMTLKHHAALAAAHVPQADALMITATGEHPTIGTKGHRPDIIPIALQGFQTVHTPPFLNF